MPEEAQIFQLKYDGPTLADHTIAISDLAPALLGLSDLVDESNHIINGDRTSISLKIKATEPGCFQVEIHAVQSVANVAIDFLTGRPITALVALLTLIGFARFGAVGTANTVIEIIRRLKGKPPKSVTPSQDGAEVELELPTGETIRVQRGVWEIAYHIKLEQQFIKLLNR